MAQMQFVFISHSNAQYDAEICERLYSYFGKHGICCWMDREDMHQGDWRDQIVEKIIDASAFILVESENSLTSKEVKKEIKLMTATDRPLIPFALDDFCRGLNKEMGSALYELGTGSLQTVFLKDYATEEQAFEKLKSYLPVDITKLKNNPSDLQLDGSVLKHYVGHDSFVEIPDYVDEIGDSAFLNNRELAKIVIPKSVKKIGKRAFFGCKALERIDGMEGVEYVDASAFNRSSMAKEGSYVINGVLFGEAVTELPAVKVIAANAFYGCAAEELAFADGLEIIGEGAFANSYKLRRITFPSSLRHIERQAFSGCGKLQEVVFRGTVPESARDIFRHVTILEEK